MRSLLDDGTPARVSSAPAGHTSHEPKMPWRDFRPTAEKASSFGLEPGIQPSERQSVSSDLAEMRWLYAETIRRLETYQQRVNEGRDLEAALDFARYILGARLEKILEPFNTPVSNIPGDYKVDSAHLAWKARELQRSVQDCYAYGKASPEGYTGVLEGIHHKLDILAAHIAKAVPAAKCNTISPGLPSPVGGEIPTRRGHWPNGRKRVGQCPAPKGA